VADRAQTIVREPAPAADAAHRRLALPGPPGAPPAIRVVGVSGSSRRTLLPAAADQLSLPFPALPALPIEADWKDQPRLWGHAYHPMCSYLASFPAALAHAFVARYTRPGDVVLDPFSGRGTTALQACAEGRIGVGNDLNPLAFVLTAAKLDPPTGRETAARLADLRIAWSLESAAWLELAGAVAGGFPAGVPAAGAGAAATAGREPVPAEVALAFHPVTLGQLLFVRSRLDLADRADRFFAAALAGILHGSEPANLSEVMPNTFSMAPRYVRDYVERTRFALARARSSGSWR